MPADIRNTDRRGWNDLVRPSMVHLGDVIGRLGLLAHSVRLVFSSGAAASRLNESVVRKYSVPIEVDEHRRQALAGPTSRQAALLDAHLFAGDRVVDIGCAVGRHSFEVARRGHAVVGVDVTEAMVRAALPLAQEWGLDVRFAVMDARGLAFRDAAFDTAVMFGSVLSHVPGRDGRLAALREAHRVLRRGGRLLVETQSRTSGAGYRWFFALTAAVRRGLALLGRRPAWDVGDRYGIVVSGVRSPERVYYHMYAPDELERDLRAVGFQPMAVDTRLYLMHYVGVKR